MTEDVIKVTTQFEYGDEKYKKGDQLKVGEDIPEKVAERILEKGGGEKIAEGLEEEEEGEEEEIDLDIGEEEEEEPEIKIEEEEEEISISDEGGEEEGEIWDAMDEDLDQSGTLPTKWNASMSSDRAEVDEEPPVNPLKGKVTQTGEAQYGRFMVVEEHESGDERTVFAQTALQALLNTAERGMYAAVRFDGLMEKEGSGQNYLAYSAALRDEKGNRVRLQEPEDED